MLDLVEAILDRGPVYRDADPFGALDLAVMGEGEGPVYTNHREATQHALESGQRHTPTLEGATAVRDAPRNGYYLPPGTV